MDREQSVQHFLDLIKKSRRGKFKIYIGMIAGVGKSYRMLQEAHELLDNGVDVQIGYIETHGRAGTEVLLEGLPVVPRRRIFYKGKELEEMDLEGIIRIHPDIVIVDELAHTNVEGSRNEKRWQDVMDLLDEGINVISAVNIQHIESVNEEVQGISGIEVKERIPDSVLQEADEVVNIDLTAEELITRLKAGYGNSGFAFTNVALKATTAIRITDSFSLPIFAQAIWNPCLEDTHLVFGITLKP